MSRPGTSVVVSDSLPAAGAPVDTGVAFLIGEAKQGPVDTPTQIRSPDTFEHTFGPRYNPPFLYDSVEASFKDGASVAWIVRLVDSAAATAQSEGDVALTGFTVDASSPGEWGNELTVEIQAPAALSAMTARPRLTLVPEEKKKPPKAETRAAGDPLAAAVLQNGVLREQSKANLLTVADLAAWAETSEYIVVTVADETLALAPTSLALAGGTNGTEPVEDPMALLDAAMAFPPTLGPGQLMAPGKTDPAQHEALLRAAEYGNRVALLDADPTLDEQGLADHVVQLRTLDVDYRGALFDPRAVVPGRAVGTNRTIPWCGIQAGLINLQDLTGNPNRAAAGYFGVSRWAGALEREWDDDARERLMHAGVNTARVVYDTVRGYGFRSLVDEIGPRRGWLQFSNVRFAMAIQAQADAIAETYVFEVVDGRQKTLARLRGELAGMLLPYWPSALYGETSDEAFRVLTDPPVNTDETVAAGEIHVVIALRMNPYGEWVEIQIVKTPITQALA
jgi:hypothetical protein